MTLAFCYTLGSPVGKNWQLAIMSPTRNLKIVLLGVDQPTRRIARSLIGQQANWNLIGEFPAVQSAVESARFIRPDFIVVDQEAIEGEFASFIRRVVSAMPHAKLLVLTWECSEQDIRASLRAGATGLLAKPEINNSFVSAIKRAASGERFLSGRLVRIVLRRFLDSAAVERTNGHTPFSDLTPREREIVRLIALGNGNKQVAAELGIAVRTAEVHRANAMKKLNLHNLAELLHFAVSTGLIEVPAVGSNSH